MKNTKRNNTKIEQVSYTSQQVMMVWHQMKQVQVTDSIFSIITVSSVFGVKSSVLVSAVLLLVTWTECDSDQSVAEQTFW